MSPFSYRFDFSEDNRNQLRGYLELEEPLPYQANHQGSGFYRPGKVCVDGSDALKIALYHSQATARFIYLRDVPADPHLLATVGLRDEEIARIKSLRLPGQLCLGSERSKLIAQAIQDVFASPVLGPTFHDHRQQNLAIFPIAREGLKYQVTEAIFENYGYYCDEVVLDAHHVFDQSVPVYSRKVEWTLFKDKDLDQQQHENIRVAFIADSIASGLVMKEVIARVKERFERLEQVEVIAPLATVRGLCRIAQADTSLDVHVRVHAFETLLNALPPDYYFSAHYDIPELHIRPDLEQEYRLWWGKDRDGNFIADTACAGYGWSEVFYSPRKQIEMMNQELGSRHDLDITDILRRNLD